MKISEIFEFRRDGDRDRYGKNKHSNGMGWTFWIYYKQQRNYLRASNRDIQDAVADRGIFQNTKEHP